MAACLVVSLFGVVAMTGARAASPSNVIAYQGRLLDANGVPVTASSATMKFVFCSTDSNPCTGTSLYDSGSITVPLTVGLFSENIGGAGYTAIPSSVFGDNATVYLEVTVNSEALTPGKLLAAAPYALNSQTLDGIDSTGFLTPTGNGSGLTTLTAANIAAGTAGISVTGNAGTVTNGVYTTDTGTVTSGMILDGTIANGDVSASAAIAYSKLALTNSIVNADIAASAAIADSKLATISTSGKVANSATTATNLNTANAIVARDASGNFSAGTITASLTGSASLDLPLTGGTLTGTTTFNDGFLVLAGATSGTSTLKAPAVAGTTIFTLPSVTGTLVGSSDTGTVTSGMILDGTIANGDLAAGTFSNITGTGALGAGSITSGFGTIATANTISTSSDISTTGTGTITSAGVLTASNGFTQTTGATNITGTSGALALSGLGASSINTGLNALTVTSSNFNTTATGINSTAVGAATASTGAFTSLSSTGTSNIGSGSGVVTVNSSGALNLTGALASTLNLGANALTITTSNFNLASGGAITLAGAQTADITTASAATSNALVFAPGVSTAISGTGSSFTLHGSNQTGTTSIGGNLALQGGSGTTTNGQVLVGGANTSSVTITPSTTVTGSLGVGAAPTTNGKLSISESGTDFGLYNAFTSTGTGSAFASDGGAETVLTPSTVDKGYLSGSLVKTGASVATTATTSVLEGYSFYASSDGSPGLAVASNGDVHGFTADIEHDPTTNGDGNTVLFNGNFQNVGLNSPASVTGLDLSFTLPNASSTVKGINITTANANAGDQAIDIGGTWATGLQFEGTGTFTKDIATSGNADLTLGASGTGSISLQNSTSTSGLVVSSSNNVGIGTSSPAAQLDESGSIPSATVATLVLTGVTPNAQDIAVNGHRAYIANNSTSTLQIVDLSLPSAPSSISTTSTSVNPSSVDVQGHYAYVMTGAGVLQIFDVTNPVSPAPISSTVAAGAGAGCFARVRGVYAYVVCAASAVFNVWDVSNPGQPIKIGTTTTVTAPGKLAIEGGYAYVTSSTTATLGIIDISDPSHPNQVVSQSLTATAVPTAVAVQGGYAYVAEGTTNTFQVVNVTSPTAPVSVGSATVTNPRAVFAQGRRLYVAEDSVNKIEVFDISNPNSPSLQTSSMAGSNGTAIVPYGRYLLSLESGTTLTIYDMGGAYLQSAETGTLNATDLLVRNNIDAQSASLAGGLSIGSSLNVNGTAGIAPTFAKNDTNGNTLNALTILPKFNFGASNTTTTVNLLNLDQTATSLTGVTNLNEINVATPALTQSTAVTTTLTGLNLGTAGALTASGGTGDIINWFGSNTVLPAIAQTTTEQVIADGARFLMPASGAITTGGTMNAIEIVPPTVANAAGTITGVDIGGITAGAATENAIQIGAGWDKQISGTGFSVNGTGNTSVTLAASTNNFALCHETNGAGQDTIEDCTGAPTADYAEQYPVASGIGYGDIVAVGSVDVTTTDGNVIKQLVKSTSAYQPTAIGVVSNNHSDFTSAGYNIAAADNPMPIALNGRVPVNVSDANGAIAAGDPITASSVAGVGMKATEPGMIIGYALAAFAGPGQGTVEVFVHPSWHAAGAIGNDGTMPTFNSSFAFAAPGLASAGTPGVNSNDLSFRGSGWDGAAAQTVGMSLSVKTTDASQYRLSFSNQQDNEVASVDQSGDLYLSGRLYPSDRGTAQTSKYIYYDGSTGPAGDMMRTNASGWSTGSYDFAEMFPSPDALVPGEVVVFSMTASQSVERSKEKESTHLAGIISTKPGFLAGENAPGNYPVALKGRVPTLVDNENGPIAIGDPLTSSSTPGYAMKAVKPGMIVGYALEPLTGAAGTLVAFVDTTYWAPNANVAAASVPGTSDTASQLGGGTFSPSALSMDGNISMNGNDILNVRRLTGLADHWSVDEDGTFKTQASYKTVITNYQNEPVEVAAVSAPENYLTLVGTATLQGGHATVEFDQTSPGFTGITSTTAPVRVLLTPDGPVTLYVANKDHNGFDVQEVGGTDSGISFDWMVYAYRKDYEPAPVDASATTATTPATDASTTTTAPATGTSTVTTTPTDTTTTVTAPTSTTTSSTDTSSASTAPTTSTTAPATADTSTTSSTATAPAPAPTTTTATTTATAPTTDTSSASTTTTTAPTDTSTTSATSSTATSTTTPTSTATTTATTDTSTTSSTTPTTTTATTTATAPTTDTSSASTATTTAPTDTSTTSVTSSTSSTDTTSTTTAPTSSTTSPSDTSSTSTTTTPTSSTSSTDTATTTSTTSSASTTTSP